MRDSVPWLCSHRVKAADRHQWNKKSEDGDKGRQRCAIDGKQPVQQERILSRVLPQIVDRSV